MTASSLPLGPRTVLFVGAGVSAIAPASLPGWGALNDAIARALVSRIEEALGKPGQLAGVADWLANERSAGRFPPEYQAQLIEEMCGERYFRALQALDVAAANGAHIAIARLAAAGRVRAIVTTNFDRLIELSLTALGVAHDVSRFGDEFTSAGERLRAGAAAALPVIKIHGCVSELHSMIDTLKQRRRARGPALAACLAALAGEELLFLGFSAADLETDPGYLGLADLARVCPRGTFLSYDGNLSAGAVLLMSAFGERGTVVIGDAEAFLASNVPGAAAEPARSAVADGRAEFARRLDEWQRSLTPASAALCLSAMAEAAGNAEVAVRLLDRFARNEPRPGSDAADFRAVQLHYGRLGAAWSRFVRVPDLNGMPSNASVEAMQSLFRVEATELGFAARTWLILALLWHGDGAAAMHHAAGVMRGFVSGTWVQEPPERDENAVDAWLSAAHALIINAGPPTLQMVAGTAAAALDRARASGDVVRVARVAACDLLCAAEAGDDVFARADAYDAELGDAHRVGDRFAAGMVALAKARWIVGPGGLARRRETGGGTVLPEAALNHATEAIFHFNAQGMDAWALYAEVQRIKALIDLGDSGTMAEGLKRIHPYFDRFEVLLPHYLEALGQARMVVRDPECGAAYREAATVADSMGLGVRATALRDVWSRIVNAGLDPLHPPPPAHG